MIALDRQAIGLAANAARLNCSGSGLPPLERLRLLREQVPGRLVFTTSFGIEDQALLHLIAEESIAIDLVTIDTGRLFPSTYELWARSEERYGIRIRSYHPAQAALSAYVADAGINGFYRSKPARIDCCGIRKVEPLARALEGAAGWITGLRSDQSDQRAGVEFAIWDDERQHVKAAPLFDWTRRQVAAFCAAEDVPVNELHAKGFPSIGCEPCTRPVRPGEPERAGRWWWENDETRECGLHVGADGKLVRARAAA